jgi:hypothetical protein
MSDSASISLTSINVRILDLERDLAIYGRKREEARQAFDHASADMQACAVRINEVRQLRLSFFGVAMDETPQIMAPAPDGEQVVPPLAVVPPQADNDADPVN